MQERLFVPPLPMYTELPEVDTSIVVRAILLVPSPDLDLVLWRDTIRERENFLADAVA